MRVKRYGLARPGDNRAKTAPPRAMGSRPGSVSIGAVRLPRPRRVRNNAPIALFRQMRASRRAPRRTIPVNHCNGSSTSACGLRDSAAPRAFEPGELESLASEEPSADTDFTYRASAARVPRPPLRLRLALSRLHLQERLGAGVGDEAAATGDALRPPAPDGHAEGVSRAAARRGS